MNVDAATRIRLDQFGRVFSTRGRAKSIRCQIENQGVDRVQIILDFDGVSAVSASFADELFGELAQMYIDDRFRAQPVAIGLTAQTQRAILSSLANRKVSAALQRQLVPH
jgi:hypothetical protein